MEAPDLEEGRRRCWWPAAARAGRGAGGGCKAGATAPVRLIRGRGVGVRGERDTDAEAYGRRTPAESRRRTEQLGPDGLCGGLVAGPADWSERVGAGRVGWVAGLRPENLRELEWSREEVKGVVVDFG
jgi:hypothetical protein